MVVLVFMEVTNNKKEKDKDHQRRQVGYQDQMYLELKLEKV